MHASSDVNIIPIYTELESQESQMDRHGHFKNADQDTFKRDCKEDVNTTEEYEKRWQRFIWMVEKFQTMWHGRLDWIKVAEHRIALESSNIRPSRSTP